MGKSNPQNLGPVRGAVDYPKLPTWRYLWATRSFSDPAPKNDVRVMKTAHRAGGFGMEIKNTTKEEGVDVRLYNPPGYRLRLQFDPQPIPLDEKTTVLWTGEPRMLPRDINMVRLKTASLRTFQAPVLLQRYSHLFFVRVIFPARKIGEILQFCD